MAQKMVHICTHRREPNEVECYAAVWSQGKACKQCRAPCYRAGWSKWQVDADNERLVERKLAGIAT